jgi:hypothetical protein
MAFSREELLERMFFYRYCHSCGHDAFEGAQCECTDEDVDVLFCHTCGFTNCVCSQFPDILKFMNEQRLIQDQLYASEISK